ncbi:MAG TPA: Uma2 family endonuclease [Solirubrobacteraceae bacterium]|jgi:Uma2 family endonuclease|nr:Uma2 family endonuclease [Solirubrobacteraceae bacterium]
MRTLLPDPPPADFQALLERRRQWGADTHDEVWEGVLHMAPAPHDRHADAQAQIIVLLDGPARRAQLRPRGELNIGARENFRVPDAALLRPGSGGVYLPTAALVVEVVSPGDETWQKLPFYAAHSVDELLIVDPDTREVHWLGLSDGDYHPVEQSALIDLGPARLAEQIDWP